MCRDLKGNVFATDPGSILTLVVLASTVLAWSGLALSAGPVYWDWPDDRAFSELELTGTAVDQDGHLAPGLTARDLGLDGPEVFWTTAPDGDGGFYVGTGHGGEVHHVAANGVSRLVARLEGTEIFSLLVLPTGDLLAGCGPEGHLYRLDRRGKSRRVGTVDGGYVWAMAQADDTSPVWLATGSPAGLYRYEPSSGQLARELSLPAQNALDVQPTAGGSLLLATQGPGLIYRVRPGQEPALLSETAQDEARQFIVGPDGAVFLLALHTAEESLSGLAGRAAAAQPAPPPALLPLLGLNETPEIAPAGLYRIGADDLVEPWWSGQVELMTAAWSPRWGWLAGGQLDEDKGYTVLHQLTPPSGAHTLARWTGGDMLDILVPADQKNELMICQAHPGAVYAVGDQGDMPRVAVSPPLDGGRPVQWGRLTWQGTARRDRLQWSVRGGNRSEPDASWTPWSKAWTDRDYALSLPPSRFLQWRVAFPAGAGGKDAGQVTRVSVSAWQDNQAPIIVNFQLEHLQGVHLGGLMNGSDNITQRFRSGLQAEFSRNATADNWAGPVRGALGRSARIVTWQGSDPNGDRISYRLDYRRDDGGAWRPISTSRPGVYETGENLASWDTAEVPDGVYDLRLTASDRRDNPEHLARQAQRRLGPVVVDNTPPEVRDFQVRATTAGFQIKCRIEDQGSALAGARLVLPDGSLERLDPADRICDSGREDFDTVVAWPRVGIPAEAKPWLVRLEARDLRGNLVAVEGAVP